MTPLVRTQITTRTDTAKTVRQRNHDVYVAPDDLKEGDQIVEPTRIMMAEFPEEEFEGKGRNFKDLRFQAGIISRAPGGGFAEMKWQDAVEVVLGLGRKVEVGDDEEKKDAGEKLSELFAIEADRRPPRKSVIKAFVGVGLGEAADFQV